MTADAPKDEIRAAFLAEFEATGKPADMAVFTRNDSEGRLHCEVTVYFSPAAAEIAGVFGALSSDRPLQEGLDLLAGSPACWSALFP